MAQESPDARGRMVAGAADMIRRRGLNATSVRELAKSSGAPLGSTYHYFPGGKYELATEAVRFAGDLTDAGLANALQTGGPHKGVKSFLAMWRKILIDGEFRAGCPVLAVTIEDLPVDQTAPLDAAAAAFLKWKATLAESLHEHGVSKVSAQRHAALIVAAVEGAVAMCRAQRSIEPFDQVSAELTDLVGDLLKSVRKPNA